MRGSFIIAFLALIGATLILVFTFFRPEEPGRGVPPVPPINAPATSGTPAPAPNAPGATTPAGAGASDPSQLAALAPPLPPSFDVVRISRNCTAVIAGRAQSGALVTVKTGDSELGRVTADSKGEWVLVPDLPLQGGTHQLTLVSTLGDKPPVPSTEQVAVLVPECRPGAPDSGEQAVAVLTPNKGFSRLLQTPDSKNAEAGSKRLGLDTVDYDDQGNLGLSGHAAPGSMVQIYINNQPFGTAKANDKGLWHLELGKKVEPGVYTLRVDQVEETGKVIARIETPFSRAKPSDVKLAVGQVVVQPGNSLWRLARRAYGTGTQFTDIYQANKQQIRDPDLIYPGQIFDIPAPTAAPETAAPAAAPPQAAPPQAAPPPATPGAAPGKAGND